MFFRALRDLARPQILAIIDTLKRSDGMAVGDLADSLKMSYMGVKQYCIELEKRGYLDTWRRPRETGRPELTYRLTPKAQVLFPQHSTELSLEVLDAVRQLHGATAAEKILYQYFLKKTEAYSKKIKGQALIERATSLAKLRDAEGHCAQVDYDAKHGLRLTEFHSPLAELIREFPSVARMEEAMLSRLLQAPVQREAVSVSGLMRITFLVAGATQPPPAPAATGVRSRPTAHRRKKAAAPAPPEPQDLPEAVKSTAAIPAPEAEHAMAISEATAPVCGGTSPMESAPAAEATAAMAPDAPSPTPEPVGDASISAMQEDSTPVAEHQSVEPSAPESALELSTPESSTPEPPSAGPRRDTEPLLFATLETSAPRMSTRSVAPAKSAAKPAPPVVEELFLSL